MTLAGRNPTKLVEIRVELRKSGYLVGEACAGLGVAARAVLDLCVGVTHDLLEHDVDEGAPLVACAGGVGEVLFLAIGRGIPTAIGRSVP